MDGQDQTRVLARRYLKGLIRVHICEAKLAEEHPGEPIWSHAAWIAACFARDAKEDWSLYAQNCSFETLRPGIVRALTEAAEEAGLPYFNILEKSWLDARVQEYLANFDMLLLMPIKGSA